MGLMDKDKLKEIQNEYMQYQYLERAPKSTEKSTPLTEVLNQIYERKKFCRIF